MGNVSIFYSPRYDLDLGGLESLHPFDVCKAGRALALARRRYGDDCVDTVLRPVRQEAALADLTLAHDADYLRSLQRAEVVAQAVEVPALAEVSDAFVNDRLLAPMRMAVQGTIDAVATALTIGGTVFNLAGGYHHASYRRGEGFCLYSDVIIALRVAIRNDLIGADERVLYIDLDAHQGNGVCRQLQHHGMDQVTVFDMYAAENYPDDSQAIARIDFGIPLRPRTDDSVYLSALRHRLPDALARSAPRLVVYNAGTDVLDGDPLGGLAVSAAGVIERDRFVIESCRRYRVPLVIVPSGGYTPDSHVLIADVIGFLLDMERE